MATRSAKKAAGSTVQAQERFAQLVALGMNQSDAYRRATGTKAKAETVHAQASAWAHKVRIRIAELRAATKDKATAKYVYEYEDAMREVDEALAIARQAEDAKAMTSAIALKAKLSGLETDPRKNDREPFAGMSDDELLE